MEAESFAELWMYQIVGEIESRQNFQYLGSFSICISGGPSC